MSPSRCVIGVGSPHGDDQVGWLIADRLAVRGYREFPIEKVATPLEILDRLENVAWLGICDACHGSGKAGTWNRWTWPNVELTQQRFAGSHDFSLTAVLNLAARLGKLPQTVVIWGVEVETCQPAEAISATALAAVEPVANSMIRDLNNAGR